MTTNKTLSVHYVGTFDDGTEFDNSRSRGAALQVEVGTGQLIPGFEQAVSEMEVGETKKIRIRPEEAYGPTNPTLIQEVGRDAFPDDFEFLGTQMETYHQVGNAVPVLLAETIGKSLKIFI